MKIGGINMDVKYDFQEDTSTLQQLNIPVNITNISIYELSLSNELNDILEEAGYHKLGDILTVTHSEMLSLPKITEETLLELEKTIYDFKKQILDYYIRVGRGYFIEGDMQIYNSDNSKTLDRVYDTYPLIGNKILTKKTTDDLNEALKIYVDDFFNGHNVSDFTMLAKKQITLAIINLAKDWDNQDESSFWQYITLKIGYRNVSEKLRDFFCKCIFETLREHKRWFIFTDAGNQYKSTVVAHAMTPKKSWYAFYDFVFDFYTEVLNWKYRKNDPLISKMVMELKNRISEDSTLDVDIEISGKIYELRDGIKKLIKYRPNYTNKLVNEMIEHIDKLVNKEKVSPNDYLALLCSEWYTGRLNKIKASSLSKSFEYNKSLAFDYKRIRPVYEFSNYEDLFIVMPEIRLERTDFKKAVLQLYINNDLITEKSLSFYGNEFGKTLNHKSLSLNEYLYLCSEGFNVRVAIICDDETIYDSKQDLYRNVICFQKEKETSVYKCKKDTSYHFFIPCNVNFNILGYIENNLAEEFDHVNCYYYRLGENFTITVNEDIVSKNTEKDSKANVNYPMPVNNVEYVKEGKVYQILNNVENSNIIIDYGSFKSYTFRINNQIIDKDNIIQDNVDGDDIYSIPLIWDDDNCCIIGLYDIEKNKQIMVKEYKLINGFNVTFSKEMFFESSDYDGAYAEVSSLSHRENISIYENDESMLFVPWDKGNLEIKLPLITLYSNNAIEWSDAYYAWNGNIRQDEYIQVEHPDECTVELFLGDNQIKNRRGKFYIGNDIVSLSGSNEWIDLKIKASINNRYKIYTIGHISAMERFRDNVRFEYYNDALYWNKGTEFIGKEKKSMKLRVISSSEETIATYQLDLDNDLIIKSPDIDIGDYRYEIIAETDDFFADEEIIAYGNDLPIGEINERRFHNKKIKIRYITQENADKFSRRKIKHTYIDKIEYKGIFFVGSEDKDCPIYNGVMYYTGNEEEVRCEYSFEDTEEKYAINPVKIIYIGSNVISIKNSDDEGLYYYRYYDKKRVVNKYYITDKDPDKLSNSIDSDKYSTADLYIYETERM